MDPLQGLLAQNAVRRLLSLYCDAVARRDADAIAVLFTPDAQVRIADQAPRVGTSEIVAGLRRTIGNFDFLQQSCDAGLIDVAGDEARARIGVVEINRALNQDGVNLILGHYEDIYQHAPEGWRFHRRQFTLRTRIVLAAHQCELNPAIAWQFAFAP